MGELPTLHERTPCWHSLPISRVCGRDVWLKMEALQSTGSFKVRGIGRACARAVERGAKRFVASSGGNAGVAAAFAGRALGVPVTVFIFQGTPATARSRMEEYGADVVMAGAGWEQAHAAASKVAQEEGAYYVHPFDDPDIWAGHSTLVDEIAQDGRRPDTVVVSVGGGGLLAGVLDGLDRNRLGSARVLAVETHGTASLHASLAAGQLVRIPKIESVAKTLGANQVAQGAFERARSHGVQSVLVSDDQALAACRRFALDHRVLVEPAAGAALAVVYDARPELGDAREVAVVVCGGVGVTLDWLTA